MTRSTVLALLLAVAAGPKLARADEAAADSRPISTDDDRQVYALGIHAGLLLVPAWMMTPFLKEYTTLTSGTVGLELTRRRATLDVVASLDLGFYGFPDGNFLGSGKDPTLDSHYTQFQNLDLLSFSVTFLWHHDMASWIEAFVGAGLGLGVVFGDIAVINGSQTVCTAANSADSSKCYAISSDTYVDAKGQTQTIGAIKPGDPDFQTKLDATTRAQQKCNAAAVANPSLDCRDTAGHPYFHAAQEKPAVMPIINVVIGVRLKLHRHFNFNLSGGFRDGWVLGGGPEYVF